MTEITADTRFSVSWTETVRFNTTVTAAHLAEAACVTVDDLARTGHNVLEAIELDLPGSDLLAEVRNSAEAETKERTDVTVTVTPTN